MKFKGKNWLLLAAGMAAHCAALAQHNWQNLDMQKDSIFGISTEKTYQSLLAGKKSQTVIVAVIDAGIDTLHEDLRPVLWTNPKDGSHGKNYMGYEKGKEDVTNLAYTPLKTLYDSLALTGVPERYQKGYQQYRKMYKEYQGHVTDKQRLLAVLKNNKQVLDTILAKIGSNPSLQDFNAYQPRTQAQIEIVKLITGKLPYYNGLQELKERELDDQIVQTQWHLDHGLNWNESGKETTEYRSNNPNDVQNDARGLVGNAGFTPCHGTHVAGIIGAVRHNGKGMDGVADNVQLMTLKVINNIRELRDEDLADAIRYAAEHGAKVINLSFSKYYTWNKKAVDEAVKFAMSKDVLIVHAAGNDARDLDPEGHYPRPEYLDGGEAKAWLEVGASGPKDDESLVADFSNFGKNTVDVFAPGVNIYSTFPWNQYAGASGTSMAAPVVAGLAALMREYYPKLTAVQVRDIIVQSVIKSERLTDKCRSGGVVNAYNALLLAAKYDQKSK